MNTALISHRYRRVLRAGAGALGLLAIGACSIQDSLLEQQQPQVIKPGDVQNATGAVATYNGALGRLRTSLNGGDVNTESIWNFAGLMSDEFKVSDTFSQRIDADQRNTQPNDGVVTTLYNKVQQSRGYARDAINLLNAFAPAEKAKIGEMYMVMGFMEMTLGQDFCNGIPLGETVGGVPQYTAPLTNQQVFTQAVARYDSALALLTATDAATTVVRNATLIAKGRAQVDLGQFAAAAATVAPVPTTYAYLMTYSITTQSNEWWTVQPGSKRYSVADTAGTGTNQATMGFINNYSYASSNDPRVKVNRTSTTGFDGLTNYNELQNFGREDPVSLVNGVDARLIEAENQLQIAKNGTGATQLAALASMNSMLNTLRATPPKNGNFTIAAMTALPVPLTYAEGEAQFFREKAFWQFARGERLNDLRRLVRQYGHTSEQVFPTGPFHKGGNFGINVNFAVPDAERSNPNFGGCLDRNA